MGPSHQLPHQPTSSACRTYISVITTMFPVTALWEGQTMGYHSRLPYLHISPTPPSLPTCILPTLRGFPGVYGPCQAHSIPRYILWYSRRPLQRTLLYPSWLRQLTLGEVGRVMQGSGLLPPTRITVHTPVVPFTLIQKSIPAAKTSQDHPPPIHPSHHYHRIILKRPCNPIQMRHDHSQIFISLPHGWLHQI